jgi:putative membrane protein
MVRRLLSGTDRERIESSIRQIEARSALEVVVAVVGRSADYWQWRVGLAASWGLASACAVLRFLPSAHPLLAVLAELPVALFVYLAFGLAPLHRLLIPRVYSAQAVHARAFQLFAERGLHHTRDHTGLLLLVSELERCVVILGDSGLHAQVGESGWQRQVALLVRRIREGQTVNGVLEVLADIESSAGSVFPPRPDDLNELPDSVIEG